MKTHLLSMTPIDFCNAVILTRDTKEFILKHESMAQAFNECYYGFSLMEILVQITDDKKPLVLMTCNVVQETPLADGRTVADIMPKGSNELLDVVIHWAQERPMDNSLEEADKKACRNSTLSLVLDDSNLYHAAKAIECITTAANSFRFAETRAAAPTMSFKECYAKYGVSYCEFSVAGEYAAFYGAWKILQAVYNAAAAAQDPVTAAIWQSYYIRSKVPNPFTN